MYPELLKIGPITIYSYGLMLGIAFLVANILISRETKRLGHDTSIVASVTVLALIGGVAGAKLFHVFENWSEFLKDPINTFFSSAGLTWYGGLLLGTLLIFLYLKKKKFSLLHFADISAPALAIGYGFGRMGCQLSGDGDYGIPTDVPWAMTYTNGTVPTLADRNPELANLYSEIFPGRPVPEDIPVHPTPLYEIAVAIIIFVFLFYRRKKNLTIGNQFGMFLILHSISRFLVEFIRLNPPIFIGLSEAQLISIGLIIWGIYLIFRKTTEPVPIAVGKKPSRKGSHR